MEHRNRAHWWIVGIVALVFVILLSCVVAAMAGGLVAWAVAHRSDDARGCTLGQQGMMGEGRTGEGMMECPCDEMQGNLGGGMMAPEEGTQTPGGGQTMTGGAVVLNVIAGSPAADASLMAGDMILAVDGQRVGASVELADVIGRYSPGDVVTIQYQRRDSVQTARVILGQADDDASKPRLGIEYRTMPIVGSTTDEDPD